MPGMAPEKTDGRRSSPRPRLFAQRQLPTLIPPPEPFSPITLRVNTSVHVTHDNNIVCLRSAPEEAAGEAARLVMEAIKAGAAGSGGVPMIDEDGRPRPLVVEVEAGWRVEGAGNVIGREDVARDIVRARLGRG
ncbi:uncharacterized protein DNG_01282 [Cephalotrichum gorgonifer]|uniref:Uncharacterized protein n=1 Tax=Cephalotrichum gorgonifer TaxID=2041049 RepID=A0AAE8SS14_9PEZI|nr:uncharacterized protein DNG_01282 [Cephalotrichum gorgonifer]